MQPALSDTQTALTYNGSQYNESIRQSNLY